MKYIKYLVEVKENLDLKKELRKRKLTMRSFGELCGINYGQVSKIANGALTTYETYRKIKKALSIKSTN